MTFLQTDKMKLSVLVVSFLLLVSAFTFLPAVTAYAPTTAATAGPMPASVSGVTATIDSPVLIGAGVNGTRTISVSNPIGNTAISSVTISIPKAAVGSGTPAGSFVAGVPAGATVQTFGSGPWAIVYSAGSSGGILIPGGATVQFGVILTTETAPTTNGVADVYSMSTSVTDTTGASTNLNSISIYETGAATSLTLKTPTSTVTAGSNFVVTASTTASGLPLQVTASGPVSDGTGSTSKTTTISPTSFTTSSSSQSITLNDTTEELLSITVNGGKLNAADGNTAALTQIATQKISPGPLAEVTTLIFISGTQYKTGDIINETSLSPILGNSGTSNITVTLADKYGNAVNATTSGGTNVTLTAVAVNAACSGGITVTLCYGFSTANTYSGSTYPYTPVSPNAPNQTAKVTIPNGQSEVALPSANYFYGIDYGAETYITATATGTGLSSSNSATIVTLTVSSSLVTTTPSSAINVQAGKTTTVVATLPIYQANVPVYFVLQNTSAYSGLFSNGQRQIEARTSVRTSSPYYANASVTLSVDTNAGHSATVEMFQSVPNSGGTAANNTGVTSGSITTVGGSAASLKLTTYFDQAAQHKSSYTNSSGGLYVVANVSDAYGNPAKVPVQTQVNFASTGALSSSFAIIPVTSGQCNCTTMNTAILAVPTGGATSYTVTGTATVGSTVMTGTTTINVVASTPTLTLTGPTTVGVDTFTGFANVSMGASVGGAPANIAGIQYSLNGAKNVTVINGTSSSQNLQYSFTLALSGTANGIVVYAVDNAGDWVSQAIIVPPLPPPQTFTSPSGQTPTQYQFPNGGPKAVNSTFTNNGVSTLQIIVVMNIFTSSGIPVTPSPTATATVAQGASVSTFELLNGLPSGTYSVTINVYSTTYLPLSPTYTVSVTV